MAEKKIPKVKAHSDQLSDSDTPDEEADPQLHTSEEERNYGTIRGSAQATQAALSHSRAQMNPTVERGPARRPKIKKLPKDKAEEKGTQTKDKCDKHLLCIITFFMHILLCNCDFAFICHATTRPPRSLSTAECLRLIARLKRGTGIYCLLGTSATV